MNGYEIYRKAIIRLGYDSSNNQRLMGRALELINQILVDLDLDTKTSLAEEIICDKKTIDAICCGVAMLISLSESDGEKNSVFASIYNSKRAAVLSGKNMVKDVLPVAEGEM